MILAGTALILDGCAPVGPNYVKPQTDVPAQWSEVLKEGMTTGVVPVELTRWWTIFEDPLLNSLVDRAVRSNKDLQLATARIREARALRGVVASDAYPDVDVSGSYSRSRRSANATPSSGSQSSGSGSSNEQNLFDAGFDANWELDVFGGVRRSVEAANAEIEASVENRNDILVTLLSEIARNYMEIRGNQLRRSIALENIKLQEQTLEVTQGRYEAGLTSTLNIAQAKAQLAATQAQVPVLDSAIDQAIHRLGVLLGQPPGALMNELSTVAPLPDVPPEVPVGLPSELLRRRPDVRQAEREAAAATARIGVAVADLFPRFFLTGALGQRSADLTDLVASGSRFWSIGPSVVWPLFAGGRIRANIEVQNARREQAFIRYEQVILNSLEDVENALVAYSKEQVRRQSLAQSVDASLEAVKISNELYSKGFVDFLNVLVNQRSLYQSQDALAQSDQNVSTNLVALFKSLGGGWQVPTP